MTKTRMMLVLVTILAVTVAGAAPVFAQAAEIAVTGVVEDESNSSGAASPKGYLLEGDYSAY